MFHSLFARVQYIIAHERAWNVRGTCYSTFGPEISLQGMREMQRRCSFEQRL